ncbi:hypothetical protein MKW98_010408 [Papaver atlanticum]|uniref:Uncharacterized protein n=1 Tax=Papaver atlanticum TaxID=357466 RepID=A0AAD4XGZ9_9MAGN|nr:hypothetical protein MKW98_010408 [Papaver atlanticum]
MRRLIVDACKQVDMQVVALAGFSQILHEGSKHLYNIHVENNGSPGHIGTNIASSVLTKEEIKSEYDEDQPINKSVFRLQLFIFAE